MTMFPLSKTRGERSERQRCSGNPAYSPSPFPCDPFLFSFAAKRRVASHQTNENQHLTNYSPPPKKKQTISKSPAQKPTNNKNTHSPQKKEEEQDLNSLPRQQLPPPPLWDAPAHAQSSGLHTATMQSLASFSTVSPRAGGGRRETKLLPNLDLQPTSGKYLDLQTRIN